MVLPYIIKEDSIYDRNGNEIPVDENGYVRLTIAGKECRFVKPMFIAWVNKNPHVKSLPVKTPKTIISQSRKKQKQRKIETRPRIRKGLNVIAENAGNKYGPFISLSDCAKNIGITKSTISKILNGGIINSKWQFKRL